MGFIKWFLAVMGALLVVATEVSPEQATTNLGAWAKYLGVDKVPGFLTSPSTDQWGMAIGVILIIVVLVPFVLNRRKALEAGEIDEPASPSLDSGDRFPDITIKEVFNYIQKNANLSTEYPEMDDKYPEAVIAKAVKDQISIGRLSIWGREVDRFTGLDNDYTSNSLKNLNIENVDNFNFTFYWVDYDDSIKLSGVAELARRVHGKYRENKIDTEYLDLRFNKAQMKSIWPRK